MGEAKFRTPPPKNRIQFGRRFKYITMSIQGVVVQNLVEINSAVTDLHCVKNAFPRGLVLLTYPSIYPIFRRGYTSHFGTILMHNRSNDAVALLRFCRRRCKNFHRGPDSLFYVRTDKIKRHNSLFSVCTDGN